MIGNYHVSESVQIQRISPPFLSSKLLLQSQPPLPFISVSIFFPKFQPMSPPSISIAENPLLPLAPLRPVWPVATLVLLVDHRHEEAELTRGLLSLLGTFSSGFQPSRNYSFPLQ